MDLVSNLNTVGFTEYEAKVYVALLREHPATGYQLSKAAGIPRSMVYEALGRLDARGAVLKAEEAKFTLYRPVPPEALLDRMANEHRHQIEALRPGLASLYTARDEGRLWTLNGEGAVLSYAEDMLARAASEAMLILTDASLVALRRAVHGADERGVSVGALLTGRESLDVGQVAYHPPRESEAHGLAGSVVVIVDEGEVLIASSEPTYSATVTTNANMVQIARQFVWMELFAQRIFARLGPDLLARLDDDDRAVFESHYHEGES